MKKNVDASDKLSMVMSAKDISRDTLSHLLSTPTRTVDDWIDRKSKKVSGAVEMICGFLLAEIGHDVMPMWSLLAARYERIHGKPVPRKGERRKKRKDAR